MIELLVHFKLGVNFETKTRLAGEWVCSCPKQVLNFMPLLPVIKTDSADSYVDFHFGCISWKASKHNRQHCIQKCNMISGNTQRLQGWGTLGSGNAQLWHSKQAASVQWFLKQPAASFGSSNYSLTFWEDISSQASHC